MGKSIRIRFIAYILVAIFLITPPLHAYAAQDTATEETGQKEEKGSNSWRPDESAIYKAPEGYSVKDTSQSALSELTSTVASIVGGALGLLLSPVFIGITDAINGLLLSAGISLDSIIYGNVGGASETSGTAIFTFELTKGNIYGTISMLIYNVLVAIFVILLICAILFRLTLLIYSGTDGQNRLAMKRTIQTSVLSFFAILIMPKMLDFVLYLRDILLYTIMTSGTSAILGLLPDSTNVIKTTWTNYNPAAIAIHLIFGSGSPYSLSGMYRAAAMSGGLFDAIMYFASVLLTLYFAFLYASVALTFSILVVMFPVVCVMQVATGGRRISEWVNEVVGLLLIPVIDAILLMFPLAFSLITIGASSPIAYTLIEFALCAAIIPARGFIRMKLGFGQPSALERSGIGAAIGAMRFTAGMVGAAKGIAAGSMAKKQEAKQAEDNAKMDKELLDSHEQQAMATMDTFAGRSAELTANDKHLKAFNAEQVRRDMAAENLNGSKKISRSKEEIDGYISQVDRAIAAHQHDLDVAKEDSVEADKTIATLQADNLNGANNQKIEEQKAVKNEANNRITRANSSISNLRMLKREAQDRSASLAAVGGDVVPGQEVLDAHATIDNFDTAAFRNISPERRIELENQRAETMRKLANSTVTTGIAGATVGGFVGGAASTFLGPSVMLSTAAAGMEIGSEASQYRIEASYLRKVENSARESTATSTGNIPTGYSGGNSGGNQNVRYRNTVQYQQETFVQDNPTFISDVPEVDISNASDNINDIRIVTMQQNPEIVKRVTRNALVGAGQAYQNYIYRNSSSDVTIQQLQEDAKIRAIQTFGESMSSGLISSGIFDQKIDKAKANEMSVNINSAYTTLFEDYLKKSKMTPNFFFDERGVLKDGLFTRENLKGAS